MTPRPGARLLSMQQASDEFGLTVDALDKLIRTGELRVVEPPHIRRRFLIRQDLEQAVESWVRRS
jgi:hypothetical protein